MNFTLRKLAQRADHLWVSGMAYQDDSASFLAVPSCVDMHLGHQRAGCVQMDHVAALCLRGDGFRYAMGGKNHRRALRHLVQFLDENRSLLAQRVDNVFIMDDLVAHVDGRPEFFQCLFDDVDGAVDAGAKTTRTGEKDGKGWLGHALVDSNRLQAMA